MIADALDALRAWWLARVAAHARRFHNVLLREHRAEEERSLRAIEAAERERDAWDQERAVRRALRRQEAAR